MPAILRAWWSSDRRLGRVYAVANLTVGVAFVVVALLDIPLGLGSYARWLFALPFGLVPLICGLLAFRYGSDPRTARPLRLFGDIALWSLMTLFTILALTRTDPEYGPLVTLVAFAVVTLVGAVINSRRR